MRVNIGRAIALLFFFKHHQTSSNMSFLVSLYMILETEVFVAALTLPSPHPQTDISPHSPRTAPQMQEESANVISDGVRLRDTIELNILKAQVRRERTRHAHIHTCMHTYTHVYTSTCTHVYSHSSLTQPHAHTYAEASMHTHIMHTHIMHTHIMHTTKRILSA